MQLLQEYVARQSDEAFAEIVRRHVNLVYSVALRHTDNPDHAQELTQAVFVILAQKAVRLSKDIILSGWLFQTARFTALTFLRGEARRQKREKEMMMESLLDDSQPEYSWKNLSGLLDEAIGQLGEKERHAIILRFIEGKSFSEVAEALGANQSAVQKRVGRGVDKLRAFFLQRGIKISAGALTVAIAGNSVQAAPANMASFITAGLAGKGAAGSSSALALAKTTQDSMAWIKLKAAVVTGSILVLSVVGIVSAAIYALVATRPVQIELQSVGVQEGSPMLAVQPTTLSIQLGWTPAQPDGTTPGQRIPMDRMIGRAYGFTSARTIIPATWQPIRHPYLSPLPQEDRRPLQSHLKKKFGLVGRREMQLADVLVLKVKNAGSPGLKSSVTREPNLNVVVGTETFMATNHPITTLAEFLEEYFGRPVVDQTSLRGRYDFSIKWTFTDPRIREAALKQALLDQLGLELIDSRERIEKIIIKQDPQ